jgi:hypothetical protein
MEVYLFPSVLSLSKHCLSSFQPDEEEGSTSTSPVRTVKYLTASYCSGRKSGTER